MRLNGIENYFWYGLTGLLVASGLACIVLMGVLMYRYRDRRQVGRRHHRSNFLQTSMLQRKRSMELILPGGLFLLAGVTALGHTSFDILKNHASSIAVHTNQVTDHVQNWQLFAKAAQSVPQQSVGEEVDESSAPVWNTLPTAQFASTQHWQSDDRASVVEIEVEQFIMNRETSFLIADETHSFVEGRTRFIKDVVRWEQPSEYKGFQIITADCDEAQKIIMRNAVEMELIEGEMSWEPEEVDPSDSRRSPFAVATLLSADNRLIEQKESQRNGSATCLQILQEPHVARRNQLSRDDRFQMMIIRHQARSAATPSDANHRHHERTLPFPQQPLKRLQNPTVAPAPTRSVLYCVSTSST